MVLVLLECPFEFVSVELGGVADFDELFLLLPEELLVAVGDFIVIFQDPFLPLP